MNQTYTELLAPGGDPDSVKAAIDAGADAVYLGLPRFGARKRAVNITFDELGGLVRLAHSRKSRIYVTMNTLMTQSEIEEAVHAARECLLLGVDAVIVQDPGFFYVLHQVLPELELHASTQMTVHNRSQVEFIRALSASQINLSRELSLSEMGPMIEEAHGSDMKVEVFVHGAYCISCSGICYMSTFMAGQSGNRGGCVQPCRRGYRSEDGAKSGTWLSLKDNNALDHAASLVNAGVDSVKIEGRIKGPSYVHTVVSSWRSVLDCPDQSGSVIRGQERVRTVFNRDFSAGYLEGEIGASMFADSPWDQALINMGEVTGYHADRRTLSWTPSGEGRPEPGQSVKIFSKENRFIGSGSLEHPAGGAKTGGEAWTFSIEHRLHGKIQPGYRVFALPEPGRAADLKSRLDKMEAPGMVWDVAVFGKLNAPLKIEVKCGDSLAVVESESPLSAAQTRGLDGEKIGSQLGRLGGTPFVLGALDDSSLESDLFLPVKELNRMRREICLQLAPSVPFRDLPSLEPRGEDRESRVAVLVSSPREAEALADSGALVVLEYTEVSGENADELIRSGRAIPWIGEFLPTDECDRLIRRLISLGPELVVCDNSGAGYAFSESGIPWIAGPRLNLTNGFSFESYRRHGGAVGGFFSQEISRSQIAEAKVPNSMSRWITAVGPIQMMTTRQCLFQSSGMCPRKKRRKDGDCLFGCGVTGTFVDEKGHPFHVVKSPGVNHRIFNGPILFLPELFSEGFCDTVMVDLRSFDFFNLSIDEKRKIVSWAVKRAGNSGGERSEDNEIRRVLGQVTRGAYRRGLS